MSPIRGGDFSVNGTRQKKIQENRPHLKSNFTLGSSESDFRSCLVMLLHGIIF